ncbi:hypothetical protein E2C01_085968 [Portunus trituberculatus]|uniref:Uncharacterized protein n=1 Tax=Portunus trituberculatus TaxID=210409 RepID=A0A5B7J2H0_PORTR|nr:hypothetical protein [Portunus trituberculatus]
MGAPESLYLPGARRRVQCGSVRCYYRPELRLQTAIINAAALTPCPGTSRVSQDVALARIHTLLPTPPLLPSGLPHLPCCSRLPSLPHLTSPAN